MFNKDQSRGVGIKLRHLQVHIKAAMSDSPVSEELFQLLTQLYNNCVGPGHQTNNMTNKNNGMYAFASKYSNTYLLNKIIAAFHLINLNI